MTDNRIVETWETTTEGTTWVSVLDPREGKYIKRRVGGRQGGSRRLHISVEDRRFNQEQIVEEMKAYDPFTNGQLVLVSSERAEDIDSTYHLTADDLRQLLTIRDSQTFQQEVDDIKSELILRRLVEVAQTDGTVAQLEYVRSVVEARYKVGGTQRTVREMMAAGELAGGEVLSSR